ncbi:hypothetical protein [Calothrix sp. 336/3]|nr:hypothetical protein [Calothrix sp. 336/3]
MFGNVIGELNQAIAHSSTHRDNQLLDNIPTPSCVSEYNHCYLLDTVY